MNQPLLKAQRKGGTRLVTVALNGNAGPWLPFVDYNPKRTGLVISPSATLGFWLTDNPGDQLTTGILVTAAAPPLVLGLAVHGAMVMGPLFATTAQAGGGALSYLESWSDSD